jgi:hypothetical protein
MNQAYCECIYGLGGAALDPVGGLATLARKIAALGIVTPPPYDEGNIQLVANAIKNLPAAAPLIVGGDSCGANRSPWVAAAIYPRRIDYMFCIQASDYCNEGCPPIGDNVGEVCVFYSDLASTFGFGTFKPPLAMPPTVGPGEDLYDGKTRVGNNGKTRIRYLYVSAPHPDDQDVQRVQNPILADIRRIIAMPAEVGV